MEVFNYSIYQIKFWFIIIPYFTGIIPYDFLFEFTVDDGIKSGANSGTHNQILMVPENNISTACKTF